MSKRSTRALVVFASVALSLGALLAAKASEDPFAWVASAKTGAARVEGEQARALVERGAALVDVRTPREYAAGHIDGALNIPFDEIGARAPEIGAADRPVVLYCHSGRRSAIAARELRAMGYKNVYDLGPKSAW